MSKWIIWLFVVFCLLGLGFFIWWWINKKEKTNPTDNVAQVSTQNDDSRIVSIENKINNLSAKSTDNYLSLLAGEDLGNNSVVAIIDNKAYLFDSTNETHFDRVVGFVVDGVLEGNTATIYIYGTVNLNVPVVQYTKYFVGNTGNIINELPENFGIQSVGYALTENKLILDFSQRISI